MTLRTQCTRGAMNAGQAMMSIFAFVALLIGAANSFGQQTSQMAPAEASSKPGQIGPKLKPSAPSGGAREGVKVHGHWTIEVRNPNGTLDKRVEFDNDLCHSFQFTISIFGNPLTNTFDAGDGTLVNLLGGALLPEGWAIQLGNGGVPTGQTADCASPVANSNGFIPNAAFTLMQNNLPDPGSFCTATAIPPCFMGLTPPTINSYPASLTLNGQFVVPAGGGTTITAVSSNIIVCTQSTGNTCKPTVELPGTTNGTPYSFNQFTGAWLTSVAPRPAPVPVSDGQTVGVTVLLTFN